MFRKLIDALPMRRMHPVARIASRCMAACARRAAARHARRRLRCATDALSASSFQTKLTLRRCSGPGSSVLVERGGTA
eukprot:COSAG02_NODE_1085_length_14692_cov_4.244775_5_plen_78_part_00